MMSDWIKIDRELILYVVFGAFTFFVNLISYFFFANLLGINYLVSNAIAWFFSVLFAYITNRIWVFESKSPNILKEMCIHSSIFLPLTAQYQKSWFKSS